MFPLSPPPCADGQNRRRLFVYNGGFLTQPRLRRILSLAGYDIKIARPDFARPRRARKPGDTIGVWGKSPTAHRGESAAARQDIPVLHVEDAFLRSVLPGRAGAPPIGLHLDRRGVHFDSAAPSDLEHILATAPLDDTVLLDRARGAIARLKHAHLSKYNAFLPDAPLPDAPYVLVIDQTRGDASIIHGGANAAAFLDMLVCAQVENPGARVIVKTHPETAQGFREGHFTAQNATGQVSLLGDAVSPWALLEGASAVYTVSSQLGFEAILAGHKPHVFGQPFYAGWGLTQDRNPVARRARTLTRAQLFAGAMILYPTWYDPARDRLCPLEDAIEALAAEARVWRADHRGHVAIGMRLWKRPPLQGFFGRTRRLRFADDSAQAVALARDEGRDLLVWAGKETDELRRAAQRADIPLRRVEDGFLRSRGLGAELVPPLSLVCDDLGIYYDPARESRLERLIAASPALPKAELARAKRLIAALTSAGLSKYNLAAAPLPDLPDLPKGRRILVPGQVEDDASIRLGCTGLRGNLDLLARTRAENPDAVILYKPHPDVEAGLRKGAITPNEARQYADLVLDRTDPIALIGAVDAVWTLTSLLGFEALLRGRPVTCLGAPFYAGWGLTRDLGPVPARRGQGLGRPAPSLAGLVHATLIGYPRYLDPVSKRPCPVEVIVERLQSGPLPRPGRLNRSLAKLQGLFASRAHLWRRD